MSSDILNGQTRKCANCGKEFKIYGLVSMWAYKKTYKNKTHYMCSHECYKGWLDKWMPKKKERY